MMMMTDRQMDGRVSARARGIPFPLLMMTLMAFKLFVRSAFHAQSNKQN